VRRLATWALLVPLLASCSAGVLRAPPSHIPALREAKLREIDGAVEQAIAARKIPGGVLWIERHGEVYRRAYGHRALLPALEAMTEDTIFDAASITKAVATAPSIWLLIADGKVALDAPAAEYLPEMADGAITIRHLLTHSSGLRPDVDLDVEWSGHQEGIRRALAETPRNRPGAVFRYSDINYLLLGEIVQRVSGQPLDAFARQRIFAPLGMRDSDFRPTGPATAPPGLLASTARVAPTEGGLRGIVHDPTARRMGGVAGHAGLFTTAPDLARFARAVLAGETFPRQMTEVLSPPEVAVKRAGGFDLDSGYARPRGDLFPFGSYGHTGWTGGFLWIDPGSRSFYVFLSNRVHPDGKGSVIALQQRLGTLIAESLTGATFERRPRRVGFVTGGADAQNGIDVLHASGYAALRGKRIGLITNQTGVDRAGNPTVDLLRSAPGVTLAALFSPEHGIRGTADVKVADDVDTVSGLPIHSLYGERRQPSPAQLAGLDALVFDVQDIGARFYTYISTMGMAMEAAAAAKVGFVVLDRVNPIGGVVVEGPVLEGPTDFIGWHALPVRHGKTVGELAELFRRERGIDVDLTVIPVKGWKREQWQDEAGLPWVNTSPNIRSLQAAGLYPGLGLLERAVSVGRGTATPFELVGAPYVDGARLAGELGTLPGVAVEPIRFTPTASVHANEECGGLRFTITDRGALRSVEVGLRVGAALARLYPREFPVDAMQPLLRHRATLEAVRAGRAPTSGGTW
jgi:uncharacterized protein YbbC (DUF1343 family)/CubicO group peptidase (beta-lactamase class C family)